MILFGVFAAVLGLYGLIVFLCMTEHDDIQQSQDIDKQEEQLLKLAELAERKNEDSQQEKPKEE